MDQRAREKFSKKMTDILNMGALNLAMGIGYRIGLFDVMDAMDDPAGSREIAEKSGLHQRYIEEWLGVMATGGVVTASRAGFSDIRVEAIPEDSINAHFLCRK